MNQCYTCQFKARRDEIGENKEAFDDAMMGNTVCVGICDTCKEKVFILPQRDMDLAIRASQNKSIHPFEWD